MDKKTIQSFKEKLEEQKKSLQNELKSFAKKDDAPRGDWETKYPNRENGSMEEEADELQEYDNLLSVEHSLELKLRDIDLALEKIKNGKYGICEKCVNAIDEERLLACPEARTCLKCHNKA